MKEMKHSGRKTNNSKQRSFWDRLFNNDCNWEINRQQTKQ
jgi:hypothetical protein